ncbi:hypothetical protein B0P06_001696 [Clostridium saccharoperbutylacetonicum]|uniref:Lipoprotein n=1 Tax=Clostridium saccharoperbutylacetonicum N1-4(HMT) TaxID=931276 RepID=M1M8H2_9CLOT|nr:hypothetical protein [Clostridium saccharoperbutylacetonicum]AGF54239.1 hypothetical protein Cspa_c04210 [Clostridium saccharoperbutylacetonicum N1-4(HMT)]NRT59247.1 hypothetical protein [Clostridium saccharoperbutylacetonicum]NSB28437.1 hypothetical protein [Clostridium saccharoperbutylacetonicum]NSB41925.1 hypothetical protein [Clostridium saccharoperbutylacetonicum]
MFYKRLLLFFILIIAVFSFVGCIQPYSNSKIKEVSMQYLKNKYNEDFEFQNIEVSMNEADGWVYKAYSIPKNNPTITVTVSSKNLLNDIADNYKQQKWDVTRGEQIKDLIETKFGKSTNFRISFVVNKEIENKYSVYTDPLDIIKKEANHKKGSRAGYYEHVYERVYVSIPIDENINEDYVAENLLDLVKYYNDLNLYFDIDLTFGKKEINEESNIKSDGTFKDIFANVLVTSDTPLEKNSIRKLIKYNK